MGLALEARIALQRFAAVSTRPIASEPVEAASRISLTGYRGIASFGLAGALSPELRPGDVVIASEIVGPDCRFSTDDAWSGWLLSAVSFARYAPIVGGESAVATRAARRKLALLSGAVIVDLESLAVAQMARAHGLRFVAVRVVVEPARREIPHSALACVSDDGETRLPRLGRLLLLRPTDIPDVVRLWGDLLVARKSLVTCCDVLSESVAAMDL